MVEEPEEARVHIEQAQKRTHITWILGSGGNKAQRQNRGTVRWSVRCGH